jgi:putative peptidoglycan lipid II flippase
MIFDSVTVPHLTKLHLANDRPGFLELFQKFFSFTIIFTIMVSAIFIIAVPIVLPFIAAGMQSNDHMQMQNLSWYFLPWTLSCIPYYCVCSMYKAQWRFQRVFVGEILVVATSLIFLVTWHSYVVMIPLAYGCGYSLALLWLLPGSKVRWMNPAKTRNDLRIIYRNLLELFFANQISTFTSFIERFFQSYLHSGFIAAYGYSTLIVNNIGSLMTFRDIFIVPLSDPHQRELRLERILICVSLLSWPVTGGIILESSSIVTILFQRGKFDQEAVGLCTEIIQLYALALWPSMMGSPMARLFQILDKIRMAAYFNATSATVTGIAGVVLVLWLGYGVRGFVITVLASSYATCLTITILLALQGLQLSWWRIARYAIYAMTITLIATLAGFWSGAWQDGLWGRLLLTGGVYGAVIVAGYAPLATRIKRLISPSQC